MKRQQETGVEAPPAPPDEVVGAAEWETGWRSRAASTGMTALVQRLFTWGLWCAVAAGPLLAVVALLQPSDSAALPRQGEQQQPRQAADMAGPGGFAEMFVDAYLTAGEGDEGDLEPYFPGAAELQLPAEAEASAVDRLAPVRVRAADSGSWSVTVSARLTPEKGEQEAAEQLRYFQVPVAKSPGAQGYIATTLPAEVAAPGGRTPVELGYGRPVPVREGDPAATTLQGFFAAYLADGGQLDRYLSPGTRLKAVTPAPYRQVHITQFAVAGTDDADDGAEEGAPPRDGERQQLLVDVEAEAGGQAEWRPMTYALSLTARDGRWEVAAMDPAPRTAQETHTTNNGNEGRQP